MSKTAGRHHDSKDEADTDYLSTYGLEMTPSKKDKERAETNPWGLTAHQCLTLRIVCQHGGTKRAAYATGESERNMEGHLMLSRRKMGLLGTDIRVYLNWDRWIRSNDE
jgi:hypothetical protein